MGQPKRVFLGSGPRPLERVAQWLLDSIENANAQNLIGLGDTLVCVPGARAGRTLLTLLGDEVRARGMSGFLPPRVMTIGRLVDELVEVETPVADRLTRTLAWERALLDAPGSEFGRVRAHRPSEEDRGAFWVLADQVRSVHAELAAVGLDFKAVAKRLYDDALLAPESEARRFEALSKVQKRWRELLDELGQVDPHEGRRAALDAGRVRVEARVVLVGVVDLNPLARAALKALQEGSTALVFAEPSMANAFDELGGIVPDERWTARPLPLELGAWRVVHGPDDQARMTLATLGGAVQSGALEHANDAVIGVPDREVVPFLVRRFGARGIRAREAAGIPLEQTEPARLLQALAHFFDLRSFEAFAALVRHPDLEDFFARKGEASALERLDAYRVQHLPRTASRPMSDDLAPAARGTRDLSRLVMIFDELEGELGRPTPRPLARVALDLVRLLDEVYDASTALAADDEAARVLRASLGALTDAADEVALLPPSIAGRATARGAIELILRAAASGGAVPPAPLEPEEPTIELVGWLDLALDPAPHVIVTGFNEGSVPAPRGDDPLLTPALREAFGLVTDDVRFAYDAYTLHLALETSETLTVISGRTQRDGTPLFPSRLAFAVPVEQAPERVDHALSPERFAPSAGRDGVPMRTPPSFVVPLDAPNEFTVTSFGTYLKSPALYHVRRELRLSAVEDAVEEMDSLVFGTFAHTVLERFGRSALCASPDANAIQELLMDELDAVAAEELPASAMATARLQIEQLRLRLRSFAEVQAEETRKGWRIEHVEWEPSTKAPRKGKSGVQLQMADGEADAWIIGKIDRIDRGPNGELRILDYKTGKSAKTVVGAHLGRRKASDPITSESWMDLQLPLYTLLAEELDGGIPTVGYFHLPGDGKAASINEVQWTHDVIVTAHERARAIVRALRADDAQTHRADIGRARFLEPIENELLGVGLIVPPIHGDDSSNEAGGGGEGE